MKKYKFWLLAIAIVISITSSFSQSPIWDIGTKWTYAFTRDFHTMEYLTNEITDTVTLDGKLLYKVESKPVASGIAYFYYDGGKVYNYIPGQEYKQLLYDFQSGVENTYYQPICDPYYPQELGAKEYHIMTDSITDFVMPDQSVRKLWHYTPRDTFYREFDTIVHYNPIRTVLEGIGFMQGGLHHTHDWEIGMYVCDGLYNWVLNIRCFEDTEGNVIRFSDGPCDEIFIINSSETISTKSNPKVYPNPTTDVINISGMALPFDYELWTVDGFILEKGRKIDQSSIVLNHHGMHILKMFDGQDVFIILVKRL